MGYRLDHICAAVRTVSVLGAFGLVTYDSFMRPGLLRTYCCSSEGPGAEDGSSVNDASSSDPTSSSDARISNDTINDTEEGDSSYDATSDDDSDHSLDSSDASSTASKKKNITKEEIDEAYG